MVLYNYILNQKQHQPQFKSENSETAAKFTIHIMEKSTMRSITNTTYFIEEENITDLSTRCEVYYYLYGSIVSIVSGL